MSVLYARKDLQVLSVPVSAGGCGTAHDVSESHALDCPACTAYLSQAGPMEIRNGKPARTMHPDWAARPGDVPRTPDEQAERKALEETGHRATSAPGDDFMSALMGMFAEPGKLQAVLAAMAKESHA